VGAAILQHVRPYVMAEPIRSMLQIDFSVFDEGIDRSKNSIVKDAGIGLF